jgi:hypothetical protein
MALDMDQKTTRNSYGYVGVDYIDANWHGNYWIELSKPADPGGLSLTVRYSTENGRGVDDEGVPVLIGWNKKVGRYQEITPYAAGTDGADADGFVPEKREIPIR